MRQALEGKLGVLVVAQGDADLLVPEGSVMVAPSVATIDPEVCKAIKRPALMVAGVIEPVTLGDVLYVARKRLGLTLRAVSAQCGLAIATISRVECGETPSWRAIVVLAQFYNLDLSDLAKKPLYEEGVAL